MNRGLALAYAGGMTVQIVEGRGHRQEERPAGLTVWSHASTREETKEPWNRSRPLLFIFSPQRHLAGTQSISRWDTVPRGEDQGVCALAAHLVSDKNIAALGVTGFRPHPLLRRRDPPDRCGALYSPRRLCDQSRKACEGCFWHSCDMASYWKGPWAARSREGGSLETKDFGSWRSG
jgi:hypothetical protein